MWTASLRAFYSRKTLLQILSGCFWDNNKISHSSAVIKLEEKQNTDPHCRSDALKIVQVTTTIKPQTDTELPKNWKKMKDTTET